MEKFNAWAIDTPNGLLSSDSFGYLPPPLDGCQISLFTTRAIARNHCQRKFEYYKPPTWRPKVIKVKVTIEKA